MKAVRFSEFGGIDKLQVVDVPQPEAGKGQVLVQVKAAALNPGDAMLRKGLFESFMPTKLPSGNGSDFAGIVTEVGDGVTEFEVGDEVAGYSSRASHAEFVLADVDKLTPKPKGVSWEVAGSLCMVGNTALATLEAVGVEPGDTLVIAGAAGGVGGVASQVALLRGARVIGIASDHYHEWLRGHGVTPVSSCGDVAAQIHKVVEAVGAFIDTVGHGYVDLAVELGVDLERINTTIDFDAAYKYHVQSKGSTDANGKQSSQTLLRYLDEGKLELPIAKTFSIDQVRDAYAYMENEHGEIGKALLVF